MDPIESIDYDGFETYNGNTTHVDHGWKKVVYPKRHRKQKPADQTATNGQNANGDNVFRSLEEQAEDRRKRILAAKMAAVDVEDEPNGSRSYGYDESDDEIAAMNEKKKAEETKKPKPKKEKKPKVSLPEAAAKIDPSNLEAFLIEASEAYATQPEIQLMRFADYFGRALSGVSSVQFPWVKMFKESPLSKLIDVPLSHIPEPVYKTSVDWINQRPVEALGGFVLWAFDCILTDLAAHQGGAKGGKKGAQQTPSKSQVAIFVALAMVLRRKPDALTNVLPTLRENAKYQGQDKLPVTVWMMAQASQGDLSVGLLSWAHNLLPVVGNKNCNPQSRDLILQLVEKMLSNPWNIGYAIAPTIARGMMLGQDQPMILHLLDIEPASKSLEAVKMELQDSAFPLLHGVFATTNIDEACKGVNIAIMIGGFARKEGMERREVMSKNAVIFKAQASALERYASDDCKVLVVANPANTNALILKEFAPSIPEENITCLTRLDHNRAQARLAEKLSVPVSSVKNVIVWGNHSSTQYPDSNHATVSTKTGDQPVNELLVADQKWLKNEFITEVQQRGAEILRARRQSSALSAASAACDHIHDWFLGTPKGNWVSMGVCSDGSYGIPPGLVYSFPVICEKGSWKIVQGLNIDEFSREKMDDSARELAEEKALAYSCLNV